MSRRSKGIPQRFWMNLDHKLEFYRSLSFTVRLSGKLTLVRSRYARGNATKSRYLRTFQRPLLASIPAERIAFRPVRIIAGVQMVLA